MTVASKKINGLYAITPDRQDNDLLLSEVRQAIDGGVKLIQYRAKNIPDKQKHIQAKAIKDLCDDRNVNLIINDNIELSMYLDAFGVHLGKDDDSIENARKMLGSDKCIGISCYNSIERVKKVFKKEIDYIALGAFFPTKSKPNAPRASLEMVAEARTFCKLPIVAIGGIDLVNISMLLKSDINAFASISSIFNSGKIESITNEFNNILKKKIT